ncbi:trans-aconitate 2-methyltransferase [Xylophilus rhododendri]|uniref:Trans-aconitate 2-methyltransferase n=1 Tax=Xylophilus rhododendri TaxID=2697032 RepID=A0A857JCI4_9BURK|nr:trans-aconitate 2-methyltransferase [Xylophilus rhododendri]QHJ00673.1 trans-aconitate 2-methyltransferase [Xylophilus rhododendri]
MAEWNPSLYSRFEDERTRPARELLARVPLAEVRHAVDLGCGPANSTELIVQRFPGAETIGTDNSKPMLDSARKRLPGVRFDLSDISTWQPETAPDLIYANASLQWVPGHETLIPRLFDSLAPGGVLAIQMPDNRDEPTHRAMRDVGAMQPWAEHIGDIEKLRTAILPLSAYYDMLAPQAENVDVWHTIYQHRMDSPQAIVDWVSGTGLKPFVAPLDDALKASYLAEYLRRIEAGYPPRADGKLLLAFPRMFIVAQKKKA